MCISHNREDATVKDCHTAADAMYNATDSLATAPPHVSHTWRGSFMHLRHWTAQYNTGLLIKLTPKGELSSFFSFLFISSKHESSHDLHPVTKQAAVHLVWLAQKDEQRRRHEAKAAMKKNRRLPQWYLHTAAVRPGIDSQDVAAWSVLLLSHSSYCLPAWC